MCYCLWAAPRKELSGCIQERWGGPEALPGTWAPMQTVRMQGGQGLPRAPRCSFASSPHRVSVPAIERRLLSATVSSSFCVPLTRLRPYRACMGTEALQFCDFVYTRSVFPLLPSFWRVQFCVLCLHSPLPYLLLCPLLASPARACCKHTPVLPLLLAGKCSVGPPICAARYRLA